MLYNVGVKQVHTSWRLVEADSPEEACAVAEREGQEINLEYDYTLDPETFTVEEDDQ